MYKGTYTLIGLELSMFTRKLEAQLRYQKIPYQWQFKTMDKSQNIEQRSGTRFIPLLETPDGWIINDTISIGPMLSDRFPENTVIPSSPNQRALCFIIEDYYNHWMPRHALHSRWCYEDNVLDAGINFGANMVLGKSIDEARTPEENNKAEKMGAFMRDSFGLAACETQGAGPDKKEALQADYQEIMSLLSDHFKHHGFLLGGRACLADFALVGPAVGHFLQDPEPRSWLGEHEQMLKDYVARVWNGSKPDQTYLANDEIPSTLWPILEHAKKNYHAFALASIEAAAEGKKFFDLDLGHGQCKARSMKRLDKSRLHVQNEIENSQLKDNDLKNSGILDFYLRAPMI
ncbi:MAG: hypothetical protein KUG82_07115 [Pseudomonadales bacterium]|nr:hypothetical protein [Pseudomonadales bacterium]